MDLSPAVPQPDSGVGGPMQPGVTDSGSGSLIDVQVPPGSWTNVTANLANIQSACGTLSFVSAKPDEDFLIAGIAGLGLWGSRDGGTSWQKLGMGAGSASITNNLSSIVYDPMTPMRFWESGIYGPGLYETMDDGQTFVELGTVSHDDLISVDLSDPARSTLLAGGHEQSQTLYRSTDGGKTWNNVGSALPANSQCTTPVLIDKQTYLMGCAGYGNATMGIMRSVDAAASWKLVSSMLGGSGAPLRAKDGSIYWNTLSGNGLVRSIDSGVTWMKITGEGLIMTDPVELPDGRIAALGKQYVLISADHGSSWTPASAVVPMTSGEDLHGLAYSAQRKAFYVWHNECSFNGAVPVAADAIMSFAFDYTKE